MQILLEQILFIRELSIIYKKEKRANMKKTLTFITAFAFAFSCVSCNRKNGSKEKKQSFAVEKIDNIAYKKSLLTMPDNMTMIYSVEPFEKCSKYFILGTGSSGMEMCITDADLTSFTKVDFPEFNCGASYMADCSADGTLVTFVNDVSYGDLPAPDYSDPDFDQAVYDAAAKFKFKIITYSTEGKIISDNDVKDFSVFPEQSTTINECVSDGKTVIVNINGSYEMFETDGTYIGSPTAGDGETVENIGKNSDGELIAAVRADADKIQLRKIIDKGEIEPDSVTYELSETVYGEIQPGWGDYTMFVRTMTAIYGIRSGDSSIVPLFNLNKAGLNSSNFSDFIMCTDDIFAFPVKNYSNWTCSIKRFAPCSPEELENIPMLSVGIVENNFPFENYLEILNDENQEYQVEIKQYGGNNDENSVITEQIQKNALNGDLPDVIIFNGLDGRLADFDAVKMETLCDLYEFMDKDDTLNRDSFVPGLLDHIDYNFDGHAYLLPSAFKFRILNAAKTEFVKDIEKWDFNTYMDMLENPPEGMAEEFKNNDQTQWQRLNVNFEDYFDFKNASCKLDSPDFIRALKYAYEGKQNDTNEYVSEDNDYDQDAEQRGYSYSIRENRELFSTASISNYADYIYYAKGIFGGEPFTVLGDFNSGNGIQFRTDENSYGITKQSENKELAWKFIKHMLSDDYISKYYLTNNYHFGKNFPPTKSGIKLLAEYSKKPMSYTYNSQIKNYSGVTFDTYTKDENGEYIYERLGYVDDNVIAEVDAMIASAKPSDESYIYGDFSYEQCGEISAVFNEEVERFFHGECSAEECASIIQNRLTIYLSENYD